MRVKNRTILHLCIFLLLILSVLPGCAPVPEEAPCAHSGCTFVEATPADFFREGTEAHYLCQKCGATFDFQMVPAVDFSTPSLSPQVSLCLNGNPIPLTLEAISDTQINWISEGLLLHQGDVITLCNTENPETVYPFSPQGILDASGTVQESSLNATVSLVATRDSLTLFVLNGIYPGYVAIINGEQHPMQHLTYPEHSMDAYVYGFVDLNEGDTVAVRDNIGNTDYGYSYYDPANNWSTRDTQSDSSGALVIGSSGRYLLKFSQEDGGVISLLRVFAPAEQPAWTLSFPNSDAVSMTKTILDQPPEILRYATLEGIANGEDIARYASQSEAYAFDAVVYLEEGSDFRVSSPAGDIAANQLTAIAGNDGCITVSEGYIRVTQSGTYHIRFCPYSGCITVTQLSTGSIRDAALAFDRKIAAIPSNAESYYANRIRQLYGEYQALSVHYRPYLKSLPKLEAMYRKVVSQADTQVIYIMSTPDGNPVYTSKAALCNAFYTDFYYYIAVYHGTDELEKNGIHNVQEFVTLAQDFDGMGMTNLYGIGYVAGPYFLESRANNVLENQSEKGFLGFCFQNGMYVDLIPFLTNFFAYWRIDEGYANSENPGADIFAEAWAPTVDIAKFFYYDADTSYVQSARVLDCFTNTACVVYGFDDGGSLPEISLRGYIFEGWYDNPGFLSSPLTELPEGSETIRLYAKWSVDEAQQNQDSANLVDIYIYNLTTKRAYRSEKNIGYVKTMYDSLTPEAQALVENYAILQSYT